MRNIRLMPRHALVTQAQMVGCVKNGSKHRIDKEKLSTENTRAKTLSEDTYISPPHHCAAFKAIKKSKSPTVTTAVGNRGKIPEANAITLK